MRRFAISLGVLVCALTLGASAVLAQEVPRGFVRHVERQYWTWFGPADWIASYGAYGIVVTSPAGLDVLDYGFSSVLCAASPGAFFRQRRAQLRTAINLQGLRFFNATPARVQRGGSFRQTVQFSGRVAGGPAMRGEVALVYAVTSPPYCYGSTLARYAPAARYAASIKTLRKIWDFTYYSGNGACLGNEGICEDPPPRTR